MAALADPGVRPLPVRWWPVRWRRRRVRCQVGAASGRSRLAAVRPGPPASGPPGPRGSWRKRGGAPAPLRPGGVRASGSPQLVLRSHSSKRARRVRRIPGSAGDSVHPITIYSMSLRVLAGPRVTGCRDSNGLLGLAD